MFHVHAVIECDYVCPNTAWKLKELTSDVAYLELIQQTSILGSGTETFKQEAKYYNSEWNVCCFDAKALWHK